MIRKIKCPAWASTSACLSLPQTATTRTATVRIFRRVKMTKMIITRTRKVVVTVSSLRPTNLWIYWTCPLNAWSQSRSKTQCSRVLQLPSKASSREPSGALKSTVASRSIRAAPTTYASQRNTSRSSGASLYGAAVSPRSRPRSSDRSCSRSTTATTRASLIEISSRRIFCLRQRRLARI